MQFTLDFYKKNRRKPHIIVIFLRADSQREPLTHGPIRRAPGAYTLFGLFEAEGIKMRVGKSDLKAHALAVKCGK